MLDTYAVALPQREHREARTSRSCDFAAVLLPSWAHEKNQMQLTSASSLCSADFYFAAPCARFQTNKTVQSSAAAKVPSPLASRLSAQSCFDASAMVLNCSSQRSASQAASLLGPTTDVSTQARAEQQSVAALLAAAQLPFSIIETNSA